MTIAAGSRLGPYEIVALLGAGGMGEVWRATDPRLGRDVAIKLLPLEFSTEPERLARFDREARVLASLNHPNIAAIYGLEESGERPFLVLELAAGETLAERLAAGPLAIEEALTICAKIAEALEAAHEKGIVHRDLKPANIKVAPGGKVKVLDFGLARALAPEESSPEISRSPTVTPDATQEGVLLGTAAYMSPEQARGKRVDRRCDIWAFGCVLYETLTGRKVFEGETVSDTLAAILRSEPDWAALPDETPERIRALLNRCLRKDPDRRLRDVADARLEIEDSLERGARGASAREVRGPRPQMRFVIPLVADIRLATEKRTAVAISPAGSHLVYVGRRGSSTQLYLRAMDRFETSALPGTEDAGGPFFSSDGYWIGFFAQGKLWRVSVTGGAPLTVCDAPEGRGACWGPDETIFFSPTPASAVWRVPASGGAPAAVTTLDFGSGERTHRWPSIAPGGRFLLFTLGTAGTATFDDALIALEDLSSGERSILVRGGTDGRYAPTGHLVYARAGSLLAAPLSVARPAPSATVVPVLEGGIRTEVTGAAHYAFSRDGTLVHAPGGKQEVSRTVVSIGRDGVETPLSLPPRGYEEPRLSPDGGRLALAIMGMTHDIWVQDLARETLTRLTYEADNFAPIWTPDGKRITFSSNREGPANLFWKSADGSAVEERLAGGEYEKVPGSWSPDGKLLAFTEYHVETGADIWLLPLEGDRSPRSLLRTPFNEYAPMFSPDGRFLAYTSDESGRDEVYVIGLAGGGKWQLSTRGGAEAVWSRSGRELFYREGNRMMSVPVATEPDFSPSAPRLLFERQRGKVFAIGVPGLPNYDVGPGDRFVLFVEGEEEPPPNELAVTLEWFEELRGTLHQTR